MTPDGEPQTPRNKDSSSSLLAAFKSLTGSKPRNPSSTGTQFTPSATPPVSVASNPFDLPLTNRGPHEGLDGEAAEALRAASDLRSEDATRQTRPSGPPGLRSLLGDLQQDKSTDQRVSAARAIIRLLSQYTGADVISIWTTGQPLLKPENEPQAQVAALELLNACVRHKDLTPVETKLLFQATASIAPDDNAHLLSLRLDVLRSLTNNGRNIADVGSGLMRFLMHLLEMSFNTAKGAGRSRRGLAITEEERNLEQLYDFVLDTVKFNSKAFTDSDLDLLISTIQRLANKATMPIDLRKTIEIIDALTTYSCLPQANLRNCVTLLCGTFSTVKELRELAWRTTMHLLGSHLRPATINVLISMLKNAVERRNSGVTRGACQLVTAILQSSDVDNPPPTVMPKLISACRKALEIKSDRLAFDMMRLILQLCDDEEAATIIFHEKTWAKIEEIVTQCAGKSGAKNSDDRTTESSRSSAYNNAQAIETTRRVAGALISVGEEVHVEQKLQVIRLLMRIARHLDDSQADLLIDFYREDCLLVTSQESWREDCQALLTYMFKDYERSNNVRQHALQALRDAHDTADALGSPGVNELLSDVLQCISLEPELNVIDNLCQIAIVAGTDTQDQDRFITIVECLKVALHEGVASTQAPPTPFGTATFAQRMSGQPERVFDSLSTSIAKAVVKIFLRTMNTSAWKARLLYDVMLAIARSSHYPAEARIIVLKLLFRLRAETNHNIFIVSSTECEGIAAVLCRTAETASDPQRTHETPSMRPVRSEDQVARRSNPSSVTKSAMRGAAHAKSSPTTHRMGRPTPPLWLYPGPKGLPEEPPAVASRILSTKQHSPQPSTNPGDRTTLRIGAWLELLLEILQQDELEWEVYSYSLVHLGAQLSNHALFAEAIPQVQMLRSVICSQLANKNFHEPPPFTGLKRSDAATCLYHVLTILISYRQHFSRNEEDEIVKMFVAGIGSWERTTELCIHGLSTACHELPQSFTKNLDNMLQRMIQIITQTNYAVHILEFLARLARLPELFKNFREEEFKVVFGICLRYLEDVRESRGKSMDRSSLRDSSSLSRPTSLAKDSGIGSRPVSLAGSIVADDLPQYVYAIAHHVLAFWFIALKLQDRNRHVGWISERLSYRDSHGRDIMEEQGQVTVDLMQRVAFSDRDETAPNPYFATETDGLRATKSWIVGKSIVTIETAGRTGFSQIIRRRPTGTTYSTFRPTIEKPLRHHTPIILGSAAESYYKDDYVGILPEHVFQEFYAFQDYLSTPFSIELPGGDEAITRAINTFDRISPLDGHKIGILYVGEGQTTEPEILSNIMGSADYTSFLSRIGSLITLRNAPFNTQGLDRSEAETDGKFTFAWRDRVSELVFHVTTMMPNYDHDPGRTLKKRHIGNDFVNIIFNNSGKPWELETIPSDFNHVNIVIAPEARASFVETRLQALSAAAQRKDANGLDEADAASSDPYASLFYKVTVLTKAGIPTISPAHITKIVSGASLPAFVRLLALNASSFAQVWANRESAGGSGDHTSSWRSRLEEIVKLRSRYGPQENMPEPPRSSAGISTQGGGATNHMPPPPSKTQSMASSLAIRESGVFRRQSKPFISYNPDAGTDMERSSSAGSSTRN